MWAASWARVEKLSLGEVARGRRGGETHLARSGGAVVDLDSWRELQRLEALTYVPASAKSRQRGAGAGHIDND